MRWIPCSEYVDEMRVLYKKYCIYVYIIMSMYPRLLQFVGIFVIIMIFLNISECGGGICRGSRNMSRERNLEVTKNNPSALNKAIDAL